MGEYRWSSDLPSKGFVTLFKDFFRQALLFGSALVNFLLEDFTKEKLVIFLRCKLIATIGFENTFLPKPF